LRGRFFVLEENMTENNLFEQFENATLDAKIFTHSNHIKTAWIYLTKFDLLEAMTKFSSALKRFAKANKADKLYNETITFAFMILINERMKLTEHQQTWKEFAEKNSDLFDWKEHILKKYYREETLKSAFAKKHFVFPDKLISE
jgi:hypothetical protein